MLFNAVQVAVLLAAVDHAVGASTERESIDLVRRQYTSGSGLQYCNPNDVGCDAPYGAPSRFGASNGAGVRFGVSGGFGGSGVLNSGYRGGVNAGVAVTSDIDGLINAWGSLASGFSQLQLTISGGASIDVALQSAWSLRAQVQSVTSQWGSCAKCTAYGQDSVKFQSMTFQLFSSMQSAFQIGYQRYGYRWQSQFRPVFQQCTSAFYSLKQIAASLRVDLTPIIQRAGVNVNAFAGVGLNLGSLLQLNLNLGGRVQGY